MSDKILRPEKKPILKWKAEEQLSYVFIITYRGKPLKLETFPFV